MKRKINIFTAMRIKSIFNLLVASGMMLVVAAACSKGGAVPEDNDPHNYNPADTIPPVLLVNTPIADQQFTSGASLNVTGNISDNEGLYRGSIRIINDANGEVLKQQLYEIHGVKTYNFNVSHTAVVSTVSNYTVSVSFEDHGLNTAAKSIRIKVNP
jgi:hypothetical protein